MKFHHISDGKNITKNNRQKITARGKSLSRKHVSLAPFAVLAVFAVATIASPVLLGNNFARADSYDDQISALNSQNSSLKAQVSQLALQAGSISAAITALQNQQAQIQVQINASNAKIADLNAKIATDDQQIKDQSQALVTTLQNIYYDSQSNSTLNILMNSNSISDYVDAQARQTGVQNNLQKSIDNINALKKQLADQKAQVQTLLNSQVLQKQTLAASQAEQQSLENANQAQQNDFNSQVSANNTKIAKLKQDQADANATAGSVSSNSACGGGYPYCGYTQDSGADPWGLFYRECVSYAAYKVESTYGNMPYIGDGVHGDAKQWPAYLKTLGVPEGSTPKVGSVAIRTAGSYGHAAWVESVNGDEVTVSQYNWYGYLNRKWYAPGQYSVMTFSASYFNTYIYFGQWSR